MAESKTEIETLFNYKGKDILVKREGNIFRMGMGSETGINIWFNDAIYNSIKLTKTSGRDFVRNIIDKMLYASRKK